MDKGHLHHLWTRIRPIKVWYFFVLLAVSATICLLALKNNNLMMIKLRKDVYAADKNNGDIEGALQRLRTYVATHMNTNLNTGSGSVYPPIQLKYTYGRLQNMERQR